MASKPVASQAGQRSEVQEVHGALITGAGPVQSPGPGAEAYGSPEARTFFANAEEGLAAMDRVRLVHQIWLPNITAYKIIASTYGITVNSAPLACSARCASCLWQPLRCVASACQWEDCRGKWGMPLVRGSRALPCMAGPRC